MDSARRTSRRCLRDGDDRREVGLEAAHRGDDCDVGEEVSRSRSLKMSMQVFGGALQVERLDDLGVLGGLRLC